MPKRTLSVVVVGCGAVVDGLYRGALRKLESRGDIHVTGLVDPDPARTAALGRHFRSARQFTDLAAALADGRPDLVIVASPPSRHAEHAVLALETGSHVLCEKPMTTSVEDGERMIAAARNDGGVLAVGMARRMFSSLAEARSIVESGALGERLRFVYREGLVYSWPVRTDAPFRRATAGGGVLTDFGSHVIDFLHALFGPPSVRAYVDDAQDEGVETNCQIALDFPRATGVAQLSWSQPLVSSLLVSGTEGELRLDPAQPGALRVRFAGGPWETRAGGAQRPVDLEVAGQRRVPLTYYDCIHAQLVQTLRAIVHGEAVGADGHDGLVAVRAIADCYRQAAPLRRRWLTTAEQDRAEMRHWSRRRWAA